jgi:hypothetical protein
MNRGDGVLMSHAPQLLKNREFLGETFITKFLESQIQVRMC